MYECFNCGSRQFKTLFLGKDRMFGLPGEFIVDRCEDCGQISTHPLLSEKENEKFYPTEYLLFTKAIEDEKNWFKRFDRTHGVNLRCRAVISNSKVKSGHILDIGCATGIFLHGMQLRNWDCYGIEPSDHAANYARKRFNLRINTGYLENGQFPDSFFDIITLWDVFEHLPSPIESLNIVNQILKPGGLLMISTPNIESWTSKIFGKYWAGWETPRHYHVYSPQLLSSLLNKTGFKPSKFASFTGNFGSSLLSFQFLLNEKVKNPQSRQWLINLFGSVPSRLLTYPYFKLAQFFKKGSSMTMFAHKVKE
jgi:2-polyprenyl-3-methyl-5-hydroxy-6-metoxy-1,4-benzoquinol methylase